ncbi:Bug family tripartite tricarboxylate transporter substrate binding protein [Arthrobacter sp. Z4-13]
MSPVLTRGRTALAGTAVLAILLGATGCADRTGSAAAGGDFPSKTITFMTPTSAGGATDLTARTLATEMEKDLGVSIVVENRPGGSGSVGMEHLAGLPADGYTIAVLPVEVSLLGHQGYDIKPSDYKFLGQANSQPGTIAVPANSPFRTLEDLIRAAKDKPGSVAVSNAGPGSIWELGATELGSVADVKFKNVPFDGGAPAVTAATGGQVDAVVAGIGETAPAHKDGRLRVLAVFTEERAPVLPDVPTAGEQGHDVVIGSWAAVAAPTGLAADTTKKLEESLEKAVRSEAYTSFIEKGGNLPLYRSADETAKLVDAESNRFAKLLGGGS